MESKEGIEESVISSEHVTPKMFIFSAPNIVIPPKPINSGFNLDQMSHAADDKKNVFTFAIPTVIQEHSNQDLSNIQSTMAEKQYKPKISRNSYTPAVSVFVQALKESVMFKQLKKNSRLQITKINPENSVTCTNVPPSLLTKTTAKEYFNQFGNVLKITIRPKKQTIIVIYATKEEANIVYNKGGEYYGDKFNIQWTKLCLSPKSPTKKKDLQKNIVSQMVSNIFKSTDDEIKSELNAMMNQEYNIHNRNSFDSTSVKKNKMVKPKIIPKLTTKVEKSASKTEKHKSDNQISYLSPNATMKELQTIIQQPAHTSEDKYKVLEARDRLMRMKQVKSYTLAAAKVMRGICPDMCPEKERLMRESKRQVALYEQLDTNEYGINHMVAVKQYSRSSADQEEPMAHDLRSVKSLKMTMSYLLHEIANLCDREGTNLGEWYNFMWDRTRGIRKDITQQELCCTDSVELVEQCARFHVVCSERLCAEKPSTFDKKINSDNLTKCLQSLKYMYHDLRVKGINCKNESEFRAYIILLNLNNGNFMWDLQRLPRSVQKSPEVQFALDVYFALVSNNYYKFFKLVKITTYLNACILLRYFNQVRFKALSVLVKAYCRTASTAYPLYELIDTLGFEDENEAVYFCEQVGLNISKDGLYVLLNRHNFTMPVLNIKQNRAYNVIESKRTMQHLSIGECIAGGRMPERAYKYHKPHNSFDTNGYLMPDSINAEDQNKGSTLTCTDPYEFIEEYPENIQNFVKTSEKLESNIKNLDVAKHSGTLNYTPITKTNASVFVPMEHDVNNSITPKLQTQIDKLSSNTSIRGTFNNENQNNMKTFTFASKKLQKDSTTLSNIPNSASRFSEAPNIFSKQLGPSTDACSLTVPTSCHIVLGMSKENAVCKNLASSTVLSSTHLNVQTDSKSLNIINPIAVMRQKPTEEKPKFFVPTTDVKGQISQTEMDVNLKLEKQGFHKEVQQINETAEEVLNKLQTEVLQSYCSTILKEEMDKIHVCNTFSEDVSNKVLDEFTYEICDSILKEEIDNTQKLLDMSVKMKNRVVIKYFNVWKFNALKRKQQRIALDSTPVWLQRHSSKQCAKLLYSQTQDLVIANMRKAQKSQEDIKSYSESLAPVEVIIYIGIQDNLKSSQIKGQSNHYWKLVISWPNLQNKTVLWQHKKIMNHYLCPDDYTADPIIKQYQPNEIETLHICIRHFEGLINDRNLIGSDALLFVADTSEEVKFMMKRLTKTVLSRDKLMPIPVVFITLGTTNLQFQNEIASGLEELLKSGYLSMYTIMHEEELTEKLILNLTQTALLWLSINKSPQNPLEMDYLQNIYDTYLTEELWLRIYADSFYNEKLLHALEEPNFIIDLHNEAVTHLMDITLDLESFMYTKFAPEFKKFIKDEYMMPCSYEYFDDTWRNDNYKAKLEEVMSSFKLPQWTYTWPAKDNNTLRCDITNYCHEVLFTSDNNDIFYDILSSLFLTRGTSFISNFIDIILYIIKQKVYLLDKDLKVVYNKNHIKNFRTLPWWFKSNLLTEYKIVPKKVIHRNIEKKDEERCDIMEPVLKKQKLCPFQDTEFILEPLATFCEDSQKQVMELNSISKKVECRIKEHQQQSLLLEEKLRNALFSEIEHC